MEFDDWTDVTDRAIALGWKLPKGWTVQAATAAEQSPGSPDEWGDVYLTDVDEVDYRVRTRGFCQRCGGWIRKLDEESVVGMGLGPEGQQPEPGGWATLATGVACDDGEVHVLGPTMACSMWQQDKWLFVTVAVVVRDESGGSRGGESLGMVEEGLYPVGIDRETGEVTTKMIDPLTDPDHPLPDLIPAALHDARERLLWADAPAAPLVEALVPPPGDTTDYDRALRWAHALPEDQRRRLARELETTFP